MNEIYIPDQRTIDFVVGKFRKDSNLMHGGILLTDSNGEIYDIVLQRTDIDGKKTAGCLDYQFEGDRLKLVTMKNIPSFPRFRTLPEFVPYESPEIKKIGRDNLYRGVMAVAEIVKPSMLRAVTWLIPARPHLLTDAKSFYLGWRPLFRPDHERAVKHFQENPVTNLNEYDHEYRNLVEYMKVPR